MDAVENLLTIPETFLCEFKNTENIPYMISFLISFLFLLLFLDKEQNSTSVPIQ